MAIFKSIIQSYKKSKKLKRISKELANDGFSDDIIGSAKRSVVQSREVGVNAKYKKEESLGKILAKDVRKKRKGDRDGYYLNEATGEVFDSTRANAIISRGTFDEGEYDMLYETIAEKGEVLTKELIETIAELEYTFISIYRDKPFLNDSQQAALEELLDLIENDENLSQIIDYHNGNREALRYFYYQLIFGGAGIYVKGHYVAASGISFGGPLEFLFRCYNREKLSVNDFDEVHSTMLISQRIIYYFANGEWGQIQP